MKEKPRTFLNSHARTEYLTPITERLEQILRKTISETNHTEKRNDTYQQPANDAHLPTD